MSDIGYGDENDDDVNVLIRQQDATIDALLTRIGRLEFENERLRAKNERLRGSLRDIEDFAKFASNEQEKK